MLDSVKTVAQANEIVRLLSGLLGRPVNVQPAKPLDLKVPQKLYWGVYASDQDGRRIACAFDLNLAAYAGAALLLFPVRRANESIFRGVLEDSLYEDLREVMNVLSQALNVAGGPHFRLQDFLRQRGPLPPEFGKAPGTSDPDRIDLDVSLTGYGTGKLIMFEL